MSGYLCLAQALWNDPAGAADAWNFGPRDDDARPVQWIVEQICALWGEDARWTLDGSVHPHEARYLKLDISKARAGLGWSPRWSLAQALDSIVAWHRAWIAGADMQKYCLAEVERFASSSLPTAS